jgi:BlaI family transcriptional regulator, penicillinase repressor
MAGLPSISDAEWEIMTILWAESPLTAAEIVTRVEGRKDWNPRTVKTLLNRLVKKKALDFTEQGNRYLYRPRVRRDACVKSESRSFVSRVFGDSAGPMLVQFVRETHLSKEEIEELERILREKSKPKEK